MAGLAAAADLSARGLSLVLLEGRDRLGGRILTRHIPTLPHPLELGAEFVHGEAEATFEIADASGLLVEELPDRHVRAEGGRLEPVRDFWAEIARVRQKIRPGRDRSFATFLARQKGISPRLRRLALDFVAGYHAADPERISALALRAGDEETEPGSNRQFRIVGGYDSLVAALRARVLPNAEIRLGTVAKQLTWEKGRVRIASVTAGGTAQAPLEARAAILAVPAAVLRAGAESPAGMTIEPRIDALERDLSFIETGHVLKLVLRFRDRFWDDGRWRRDRARKGAPPIPPVEFLHAPGEPIPTWWTAAPLRSPVLTGWCGGAAAAALLASGPASIGDVALDVLARTTAMPRRRLARLLEGIEHHDWSADPFALGAYSWVAVGGLPAQKRLSRPIEGTLFLAGEATSVDETGTVAGAIESGRRAARQVLGALPGRARGA